MDVLISFLTCSLYDLIDESIYFPILLNLLAPCFIIYFIRYCSYIYGSSIDLFAKFCNSTCLVMFVLIWKGTKRQSIIAQKNLSSSQKTQMLENNLTIFGYIDSWCLCWLLTLKQSILDFCGVSKIVIFHPTHWPMLLHTHLALGNFL